MDITQAMTSDGAILICCNGGGSPNTQYQIYKIDRSTTGTLTPLKAHSQPVDAYDTATRAEVLTAVSNILDGFGDS